MKNQRTLLVALSFVFTLSVTLSFSGASAAEVCQDTCASTSIPHPVPGIYSQKIVELARGSACSNYSWRNRGSAPSGYIRGQALSFARNLCRLKGGTEMTPAAILMARANTGSSRRDAIASYSSRFNQLGMSVSTSGESTLRALFTLETGLGMRESSGNYCTGWDTSAGSSRASSEAEAGPFQTSFNSFSASSELGKLYAYYQAHPSGCLLAAYKQGASCAAQSILGSGAGAAYQRFVKSCPAFAADSAAITLRVLRGHFGPIIRGEAEVTSGCNQLFTDVARFVDQDPANACDELL